MNKSFLFGCLVLLATLPARAVDNPNYEHAKQIFNKLVEARGDRSRMAPELFWTEEKGNGAYFVPGTNKIFLEAAAYEVCATFGDKTDEALAYILSHELIHYYKDHGWEAAFASQFSGLKVAAEVNEELKDIKQQETESDLLGGFLAYSAGYNTVGIAPDFLVKLYDTYSSWPRENSQKYPSLDERIQIAKNTELELMDLVQVFETANYLVAIERYPAAMDMYDHVLSQYTSRELLNNQGVVACMTALSLLDKAMVKYAYPLELDAEARIRLGSKSASGFGEKVAKADSLLRVGIRNFQDALFLDEDYDVAVLNLGCAFAIRGLINPTGDNALKALHYDYAAIYARDAMERSRKKSKTKLEGDALTLLGIIAAETNQPNPEANFEKALNLNALAAVNLKILRKEPATGACERKPQGMLVEQVEDFDLDGFSRRPVPDKMKVINGRQKRQWGIRTNGLSNSRVLIDFINKDNFAFLQVTHSTYTGTTLEGVGIGAAIEEVETRYGCPDKALQLPNGYYWVYAAHSLVFWLEDGKVKQWCVYREKPTPQ